VRKKVFSLQIVWDQIELFSANKTIFFLRASITSKLSPEEKEYSPEHGSK